MSTYRYKVVKMHVPEEFESMLNDLGAEGWKIVHVEDSTRIILEQESTAGPSVWAERERCANVALEQRDQPPQEAGELAFMSAGEIWNLACVTIAGRVRRRK